MLLCDTQLHGMSLFSVTVLEPVMFQNGFQKNELGDLLVTGALSTILCNHVYWNNPQSVLKN